VSLTLLGHEFGNEVLSRETLLRYVPIFVAMLVWLTRILFIGAFSIAGEEIVDRARTGESRPKPAAAPRPAAPSLPAARPEPRAAAPATPKARTAAPARSTPPPAPAVTYEPVDDPIVGPLPTPITGPNGPMRPTSRIQQRPPMPGTSGQRAPGNMHAQGKNH
jgi:hypothetical protein